MTSVPNARSGRPGFPPGRPLPLLTTGPARVEYRRLCRAGVSPLIAATVAGPASRQINAARLRRYRAAQGHHIDTRSDAHLT